MSTTKQRASAKKSVEKEEPVTAIIQDSQEQEAEIKALRRENTNSNEQAQTTLDVGVITNLLLTGLQASTSIMNPELRNYLAIAQFLLLPLAITPGKIPYLGSSAPFYPYVFRIQVALALTALIHMYSISELTLAAAFRWSLPAIVAGGVWMQRRSEKEAELRLARLEKLKYNVKGA